MRPIDADALLNAYDKQHKGEPGQARKLIEKAPTVKASIERDDDFYTILICAVRYACGRETYMPELVTSWVKSNVPELPHGTAEIMIRDIEDQRKFGLGMDCDVITWERFEKWLRTRL